MQLTDGKTFKTFYNDARFWHPLLEMPSLDEGFDEIILVNE